MPKEAEDFLAQIQLEEIHMEDVEVLRDQISHHDIGYKCTNNIP